MNNASRPSPSNSIKSGSSQASGRSHVSGSSHASGRSHVFALKRKWEKKNERAAPLRIKIGAKDLREFRDLCNPDYFARW
jgi:hypothetical protein